MRIDKGEISGRQFMFSVACLIQASSLLTAFLVGIGKQDSWINVLLGAAVCLPLLFLYRGLMVMFPDKNLIQVLEEVFGKVAGKILGVGYIWFFLTLASLNLTDLGDFTNLTIMEETPSLLLIVMCVLVAAMAVRGGIRLVTKYSAAFMVTACVILIVSTLLVANQMNPENFLPVFNQEPIRYVQGAHVILTIPFGEIVIFLMLKPNVQLSKKQTTRYLFIGFGLGALSILTVVMRDTAVLGNTLDMFTMPSLVTLRLVNFGLSLSRMEILFAAILIMLSFFKITLLYYVVVLTIAQVFDIQEYKNIVLAVGALMVTYGLTLYSNSAQHAASARETVPIIWSLFEFLLPLITLVAAKIKAKKKKKEMQTWPS